MTTTTTTTTTRYITLISNDGFEFILTRDAACVAGTIKKMLDPQSAPPLPSTLLPPTSDSILFS